MNSSGVTVKARGGCAGREPFSEDAGSAEAGRRVRRGPGGGRCALLPGVTRFFGAREDGAESCSVDRGLGVLGGLFVCV